MIEAKNQYAGVLKQGTDDSPERYVDRSGRRFEGVNSFYAHFNC